MPPSQITPPWKPDIQSEIDTKYIPDEFANEPVQLTPPEQAGGAMGGAKPAALLSIKEEELPYFESFSYHGSRSSLGDYLSGTSAMSTSSASDAFSRY